MDDLDVAQKLANMCIEGLDNRHANSDAYLAGFARALLEVQGMALAAFELEDTMKAYDVPNANLAAEVMCSAMNLVADRLQSIWEDLTKEED